VKIKEDGKRKKEDGKSKIKDGKRKITCLLQTNPLNPHNRGI